jgi:hypothetical protein
MWHNSQTATILDVTRVGLPSHLDPGTPVDFATGTNAWRVQLPVPAQQPPKSPGRMIMVAVVEEEEEEEE